MTDMWATEISIVLWFVDPTSPESKSKVLLKLCVKLLTLLWN